KLDRSGRHPICRLLQVIVIAALGAAPEALAQTANPTAKAEEDPLVQRSAAEYYARRYSLDFDQAKQRVAFQDQAAGIEEDLAKLLGDQYAGIWYDNEDGGKLKVGVTERARGREKDIRSLLDARGLAADSALVPVRYTEAALQEKVKAVH